MTTSSVRTPDTLDFQIARYLHLDVETVPALRSAGKLPPTEIRDPAYRLYDDLKALENLNTYRRNFDTPLDLFIPALQGVSRHLQSGRIEQPHASALGFFLAFDYGPENLYPSTIRKQPWRSHRSPITKKDLDDAGYPAFTALWSGPVQDPYRHLPMGEVMLGSPRWCNHDAERDRPDLLRARGAFLAQLADVLAARSKVRK